MNQRPKQKGDLEDVTERETKSQNKTQDKDIQVGGISMAKYKNNGKAQSKKAKVYKTGNHVAKSGDGNSEVQKKEIATLMRDALKVKSSFVNSSHQALELMHQINTDESMSWAKAEKGPTLESMVAALKAQLSPWGRQFILEKDTTALKRNSTAERLQVELKAVRELGPKVAELSLFVEKLIRAKKLLDNDA